MNFEMLSSIVGYFKGSVLELKRVTWPGKNYSVNLTVTVLALCGVIGLIIGVADLLFNQGMISLLNLAS